MKFYAFLTIDIHLSKNNHAVLIRDGSALSALQQHTINNN